MFSVFNPSLRSREQPQRSAWEPTPDAEPVLRSRVLTGDRANICVLRWGKVEHPEKTHADTGQRANSTENGSAPAGNQTQDLLAMITQC